MTALSSKEKSVNLKRVTVYAGYGLFLFNVVAVLISIAAWMHSLQVSGEAASITPGRVVLGLLGASVVPPLLSFVIGIIASRTEKSQLIRQYNGILFGVLGMWVMLVINIATSYAEWAFLLSSQSWSYLSWVIPLVITVGFMVGLGVFYRKNLTAGLSIMHYGPFKGMLSGAVGAFVLMLGSSSFFGALYGGDIATSLLISLVLPLSIGGALVWATYRALAKYPGSRSARWTYSLIVLGFLFAGLAGATQINAAFSAGLAMYGSALGAAGLVAWGSYIILVHRLLK